MDQFILFGDSITQQASSPLLSFSFGAALQDAYMRKLDVINRGLSGYNTIQALRALPLCIPEPNDSKVRFLTIAFGANDARLPETPGGPDQHIPLEEFTNNLRQIVHHPAVQAHKNIKIILITPPPIDERKLLKADQEKYPNLGHVLRRTAENTAMYAQAIRELGEELQVPVLDIHSAMLARCGYPRTATPYAGSMDSPPNTMLQSYLDDGLHFSGEAYKLLFGELMALIEKEWPDQMPSQLPMRLPAWDAAHAWIVNGEGRTQFEENAGNDEVVRGRFEAVVERPGSTRTSTRSSG